MESNPNLITATSEVSRNAVARTIRYIRKNGSRYRRPGMTGRDWLLCQYATAFRLHGLNVREAYASLVK